MKIEEYNEIRVIKSLYPVARYFTHTLPGRTHELVVMSQRHERVHITLSRLGLKYTRVKARPLATFKSTFYYLA